MHSDALRRHDLWHRNDASIQILNALPTITSVTITANTSPITTLSSFSSTVNGYNDADGHSPVYQYQWRKNGVAMSGQTGASLSA